MEIKLEMWQLLALRYDLADYFEWAERVVERGTFPRVDVALKIKAKTSAGRLVKDWLPEKEQTGDLVKDVMLAVKKKGYKDKIGRELAKLEPKPWYKRIFGGK